MSELFDLGIFFQILVEGLVQIAIIAIMLYILVGFFGFGRRFGVEAKKFGKDIFRLGTHRVFSCVRCELLDNKHDIDAIR